MPPPGRRTPSPSGQPRRAEEGTTMSTIWRLTAFASIAALALFTALSAGAGNAGGGATYTCTKAKRNGVDVRVNVPEAAIGGLRNAGFSCYEEQADEPGDDESGDQGDQGDQGGDQGDQGSDQGDQGGDQ